MGCCTACAVRIKESEMCQPQSLGVPAELKAAGYALMCVGYPRSHLVLETVEEDEVYDMQFGRSFAEHAVDPSNRESIECDDWALEIANMDE
ncbi:g12562 [Coccomyxa viridis]|uniref:G12562 protein n=1 Tax=Coccomyxa viridis TaxID=1274662 RepID=A0ABP1GET2_9CHLO